MDVAIIDIVFIIIIAGFALRCAAKGFVSALMSIAALICALLAAIFFFRNGALIIRKYLLSDIKVLPEIISFILLFLVIFTVVKLFEIFLRNSVQIIKLGAADRFLGLIFGIAQGTVFVCLLLFIFNIQPFFNVEPFLRESFFAKMLMPFISGDKKEVLDTVVLLGGH
ncbi:MAG: CvpA family protein [Treponema sp.]|nr:CvpA family protein [Treponema sp.]